MVFEVQHLHVSYLVILFCCVFITYLIIEGDKDNITSCIGLDLLTKKSNNARRTEAVRSYFIHLVQRR